MKMGKIMIIGCGGVGSVAVQKCCQNSDAFSEVVIASRTVAKCDALKAKLEGKTKTKDEKEKGKAVGHGRAVGGKGGKRKRKK